MNQNSNHLHHQEVNVSKILIIDIVKLLFDYINFKPPPKVFLTFRLIDLRFHHLLSLSADCCQSGRLLSGKFIHELLIIIFFNHYYHYGSIVIVIVLTVSVATLLIKLKIVIVTLITMNKDIANVVVCGAGIKSLSLIIVMLL